MSLFNQYLWSLILILAKIKIFKWGNNKSQFKHREDFRVFWKFISGNFLRSNIIKREKPVLQRIVTGEVLRLTRKDKYLTERTFDMPFHCNSYYLDLRAVWPPGSAFLSLIVIMATKENDGHELLRYPFTPDCLVLEWFRRNC